MKSLYFRVLVEFSNLTVQNAEKGQLLKMQIAQPHSCWILGQTWESALMCCFQVVSDYHPVSLDILPVKI